MIDRDGKFFLETGGGSIRADDHLRHAEPASESASARKID